MLCTIFELSGWHTGFRLGVNENLSLAYIHISKCEIGISQSSLKQ